MRVIVLGGTGFIGRAIVDELRIHASDVLVIHRGTSEPGGDGRVSHLHVARADLPTAQAEIASFRPDALIDVQPYTRTDARHVVDVVDGDLRFVVLSSMDVYRAYHGFRTGIATDPVPLDETAPVREERYPYRGEGRGFDDYDKLDVEDVYRPRGATVLRLGAVYGEFDGQRREEFILGRVRAGRPTIPFGPGTLRWSRAYVHDVASAVRRALMTDAASGEVFNICETDTWSIRSWADRIIAAAGSVAELVEVPEELLPVDLRITGSFAQHLLGDPSKAVELLGFAETDRQVALRRSVEWHLAHPPSRERDLSAADVALAGGSSETARRDGK